jgi:hypothetical protein
MAATRDQRVCMTAVDKKLTEMAKIGSCLQQRDERFLSGPKLKTIVTKTATGGRHRGVLVGHK